MEAPRRLAVFAACLALSRLAGVREARADTVFLKNGNQMEGLIVSETSSQIVLDFEYGTTVLRRDEVLNIRRTQKGAATAKKMERRNFESGVVVPASARKIDALYRKIQPLRSKAIDARLDIQRLEDEKTRITAELPRLSERSRAASARLRQSSSRDASRYNEAVMQLNDVREQIRSSDLRLKEIEEEERAEQSKLNDYLLAYRALQGSLAKQTKRAARQDGAYYAWFEDQLREMGGDFKSETVAVQREGQALFVKAVINGKTTGRFIVDTGATTTLLYREFAESLGLPDQAQIGEATTQVADGRKMKAKLVTLDSIAVGQSRVKNSVAAVVPVPSPGFDGLLGMSFLSHFVMRIDSANNQLILDEVKPEP